MIVGVAHRYFDQVRSLPKPARHNQLLDQFRAAGEVQAWRDGIQGFVDEHDYFYTRSQAAAHALDCGQIKTGKILLYSEDLW